MRDLTAEELAKCPSDCDYYNIIDGDVYFTNVLGVGVYDINGNEVDDSLLDGIFKKSRHIEKPFEIAQHEWSDGLVTFEMVDFENDVRLICDNVDYEFFMGKKDAIALARHFKLTAGDLK